MTPALTSTARRARRRLIRPEYTGENRCIPCTVINLVLTSIIVAILWRLSRVTAMVFAVAALGAIAFRGYLIPGTPTLTKRYLPDAVLAFFEHDGHDQPVVDTDSRIDVQRLLSDAGVVVDVGDDVALERSFERRLIDRVDAMDHEKVTAALARLLDVNPERIEVRPAGEAHVVRLDGRWAGQWDSRAALLTDLAADRELASEVPGWTELSVSQRSEVLGGLRACLARCPVCRGEVTLGTEVVESCCRSVDVIAARCGGCDARLFEIEYDPALLTD